MDGLKRRAWRDKIAEHRFVERHTRDFVPPEIIARIETLEDFARVAADQVNRCNADILSARQDIADLAGKLKALSDKLDGMLKDPTEHGLAPMNHWHQVNQKGAVA